MFDDLFIRVASERLDREADAIAAPGAGPEIYISGRTLQPISPRGAVAACRKILDNFPAHTVHAPFMDVWPGAADDDVRRLSLEKMRRIMEHRRRTGQPAGGHAFQLRPPLLPPAVPAVAGARRRFLFDAAGRSTTARSSPWRTSPNRPPISCLQLLEKAGQPRLVHCFDFGHHHVFARIPFEEWLFYLNPQGPHPLPPARQPRRHRRSPGPGTGQHRLAGGQDGHRRPFLPILHRLGAQVAGIRRASTAFYRKIFLPARNSGADIPRRRQGFSRALDSSAS